MYMVLTGAVWMILCVLAANKLIYGGWLTFPWSKDAYDRGD